MSLSKSITAGLALAALTLAIPLAARAAEPPPSTCRLVQIGEVPIKFEDNQPLAEISVNSQPGWFIIDTGAQRTVIFGGAAKAYKLDRYDSDGTVFYGIGGKQAAYMTRIANFKLAGAEVKNLKMFIIGNDGSPAAAGLLGRDFLGQLDIEMDLANHVMRLVKPDHCGSESLAYWTHTPEVAELIHDDITEPFKIKVLLNGRRIDAILDSGAAVSMITPDAAMAAGVRPTDYSTETRKATGIGDEPVTTRVATLDTVTIGDEQIKHAKLRVGDLFRAATDDHVDSRIATQVEGLPQMLLGADFFRSHRVLFVTSQKRVYFTYSGGPVFQVVGEAVKPKDEAVASSPAAPSDDAKPASPTH